MAAPRPWTRWSAHGLPARSALPRRRPAPSLGPGRRARPLSAHTAPDLPGLGVIGQFLLQGPYWPLLELQARWIMGVFSGACLPRRAAPARCDGDAAAAGRVPPRAGSAAGRGAGRQPRPTGWPTRGGAGFGPMLPRATGSAGPGASPDAAADLLGPGRGLPKRARSSPQTSPPCVASAWLTSRT